MAALKGKPLKEKVFAALDTQAKPPYTVQRLLNNHALPPDTDYKEASRYLAEWKRANNIEEVKPDLNAAVEAAKAGLQGAVVMGGDQAPAAPEAVAPTPAAPKATAKKKTPPTPAKPKKTAAAATPKKAAAKAPPPAPAAAAPQQSDVEADTPTELSETIPVPAMEPPVTAPAPQMAPAPAAPPAPDLAAVRIAELEAQNRELAASLKAAEGERDFLRGLVQTVVAGRPG